MKKHKSSNDLTQFYAFLEENGDDIEAIRLHSQKLIEEAKCPNKTLLNQIPTMSKNRLIFSVSNFFLAGDDYKVI